MASGGGGRVGPQQQQGSSIMSERWDPVYMWLPLRRSRSEAKAAVVLGQGGGGDPTDGRLAVFMRCQIIKPQVWWVVSCCVR